ncbi:hypothetical protein [Spiroplasma endosymbiont of Polydrusus pterygomalis]|uniref:hypothetical protein n=1 Tax=Spiroplasma endosymbiont of Polydrusus pterygomalis TaxID=3139327 RepID=UPI003CCA8D5F
MPKNLFKSIIHKKYKDEIPSIFLFHKRIIFLFNKKKNSNEDMLTLTKAFSEKINISLQKSESFEENVEILTELFKEKKWR